MRPLLKARSVRIVLVLAAIGAAYAAAGFWLVPRLLRAQIVEQSRRMLGLRASVGEVRFNPFLLELRVANLAVADPAGGKLVGFDRLLVDFEASSLWRREYVFREIDLAAPYVNAVVAADGTVNLAHLVPPSAAPKPAAASAPLPRIRIASLRITAAQLGYRDGGHPGDFALHLAPIDLDLRNFETDAAGGAFDLAAATPLRENIAWHGRVSVQPLASDGEIRISGLQARTVSAFLRDRLGGRIGFALTQGRIDLDARYRFRLQPSLQLRIDGASADIDALAIAPAGPGADWIRLPQLRVTGASLDLAARSAHVDRVALRGLDVDAWLDAQRRLNLLALAGEGGSAPPAGAAAPSAGAAPPEPAPATAPQARWRATLDRFVIADAHIAAEDRSTRPAAKLVLAPLSLEVDGASLDPSHAVTLRLATGVAGGGHLEAHGTVVPEPLSAKLDLAASRLDLAALQPYVAQRTSLTLESGRLRAALKLAYHAGGPALSLRGDLGVDGLHTIDDALREDLVDWQRLDVRGLRLQLDPDRLAIARIVALRPYARVIIEPDSTLNVKRILGAPGAAPAPAPGTRSTPAGRTDGVEGGAVSSAPADASVGTDETAPPSPAPASRAAGVARAAGAGAGAAPGAKPMRVTIGAVEIEDGQANFSDLSITPNFSSGIDKLAGRVGGLDSKPGARAKVDLHGEVGPYAPVAISGEVNLFGPALYTDLSMSFRNMDLTIFNPYSGKFAGYDITKGKLTTEMHYRLDGRKLDATHHVTIDQLEFGAKTASKDAVSLPVKLAVALLRDKNGVIDLDLPVSGSLDDPKFRLGPLIWKVVVNVLEKAVAAPFKLLGALFGAGPQIQFADFRPGDAALDATDLQHMQVVAKALVARPQLRVDVPIAPLASLDEPALVESRLQAEIAEQMLGRGAAPKNAARGAGAAGAAPAFESLDPKAQTAVLAALYRVQFGARPQYPQPAAGAKAGADAEAAKIAYLEAQLRSRIRIGDPDLKALAERRAVAIEKALLAGTGVDPARVFLVANDKAAAHEGAVRLQLSLK